MAEKFKEDQLKNLPTDAPGAPPTTTGSTSTKADKKTAKKKKADE